MVSIVCREVRYGMRVAKEVGGRDANRPRLQSSRQPLRAKILTNQTNRGVA